MRIIKIGIIGCGLMGRELASAIARWCALSETSYRPEIVAICNRSDGPMKWFTDQFSSIRQVTNDYHALLANPDVEVVYCAVPHHLHREMYCDIIAAGKALLGEKPFGIDQAANRAILDCIRSHPDVFVRCSSEFPFYPAAQRIGRMIESDAFGEIIEVNSGLHHSSDMDPEKPINWKRQIETNGSYGCMGDLGMHACHLPLRAGWFPENVRAILSKIVRERPDGKGGHVPCETWDNATLMCETIDPKTTRPFPMTLKMYRIDPGEKNTWSIEIKGTRSSVRFSTKQPRTLYQMDYRGGEQTWQTIDMGNDVTFKTITGGIFEIGFADVFFQMLAAFLYEYVHGRPISRFAGCATPEETAMTHALFTAALTSQNARGVISLK